MKVVLFCGGNGMRLRDEAGGENPRPMMAIGDRPVLWHVMRYYAHFGHTDFILCLGYGAQAVKSYFLNYKETESNDFAMSAGGDEVRLIESDISDWRITFVDTGVETAVGQRLRLVRDHLGDDEMFLANYGVCLTDAPMNDIVSQVRDSDAVGSLLAVSPQESFHVVDIDPRSRVTAFTPVSDFDMRINGGYFVLRREIFDYLYEGEDLLMDGCRRVADAGRMLAIKYDGFWAPMDNLKEQRDLEERVRTGRTPWTLWREPATRVHQPVPIDRVPGTRAVAS